MQNKIAATLEPLLGADHFRAGVSADVDLTSGEQSEEMFDPQKSVMATSQTHARTARRCHRASGVPGTPSNLAAIPLRSRSTGSSNYARHTENITYQTSRVVKHTKLPQGTVKRLSLSVLVDHSVRWEGAEAHRGAALGGKTESDSRPGGRGHGPRHRPRRSTGGGGVSVRIHAYGGTADAGLVGPRYSRATCFTAPGCRI